MQMDNGSSSSSSSGNNKPRNGQTKGTASSSSPDAAVAKRGRLGPSHGTAEEGMKAFWQSVQANGSSNGNDSSGRGETVGEEEEVDEEQKEQIAQDESNEMRTESQKATGLGKRFRRYTIAY